LNLSYFLIQPPPSLYHHKNITDCNKNVSKSELLTETLKIIICYKATSLHSLFITTAPLIFGVSVTMLCT